MYDPCCDLEVFSTRRGRVFMRCKLILGVLCIVPVFLLTYLPWRIVQGIKHATSPGQAPVVTVRSELRAFGRFFRDWPHAFRTGTRLRGV
jgi:hypothetical protein